MAEEKVRAVKEVIGEVISNKMNKTIAVEVFRLVRHGKYGKYVRRSTVYKAHDESTFSQFLNAAVVNQAVAIKHHRFNTLTLGALCKGQAHLLCSFFVGSALDVQVFAGHGDQGVSCHIVDDLSVNVLQTAVNT